MQTPAQKVLSVPELVDRLLASIMTSKYSYDRYVSKDVDFADEHFYQEAQLRARMTLAWRVSVVKPSLASRTIELLRSKQAEGVKAWEKLYWDMMTVVGRSIKLHQETAANPTDQHIVAALRAVQRDMREAAREK
jgi:hypothetical protein